MSKKVTKPKEVLFSVTKKDLIVDTFRAGGKGGQHQNKTDSAVRIRHPASGAVAESRSERSQHANKRIALRRLTEDKKFKAWAKLQAAMIEQGFRDLEHKVEQELDNNTKVEYIVTWTCDQCGKHETVESDKADAKPDWVIEVGVNAHLCQECDKNETT